MTSTPGKKDAKDNYVRDDLPPTDLTPLTPSKINSLFTPLGVARIIVGLFSRADGQREPSLGMNKKTKHLRFITIGISPFCEKARWGLDLLEQDPNSPYYYTEDAHPPAFHAFETLPATAGTISRTPIVVYPDGSFIVESHVILAELCPFLYPADIAQEVKKFELEMAVRLGATIRAICYYYLVDDKHKYYKPYCDLVCRSTSTVETILFEKMLDKGIDKALKRVLKWNEEANKRCIKEVNLVLKEISERLESNGGDYIFDTKEKKYGFTAADLTFAALSQLMIRPAEMSHHGATDEGSPVEFQQLIQSFNETKAGQHCHRMYKLHRPVFPEDGKVHFKSAKRDCNPFRENAFYLAGVVGAAVSVGAAVAIFLSTTRRSV
ncbi:hypothetical protein ACA910_012516 [Epithemia clementina (nom. ined.)]